MTLLKKMLGFSTSEPVGRIRICPECGMAVADHKDWCSIFRARQAMERRTEAKPATA